MIIKDCAGNLCLIILWLFPECSASISILPLPILGTTEYARHFSKFVTKRVFIDPHLPVVPAKRLPTRTDQLPPIVVLLTECLQYITTWF